jgi:hypothetical protein
MASLYMYNRLTVPYVQLWSAEHRLKPHLTRRLGPEGAFLGYADELPYDRDQDGALWVRYTMAQGKGEPRYTRLHPHRQRRVVTRGLCQVCAHQLPPPDVDEGLLFLMQSAGGRPIQEGERTQASAMCTPCARRALRECAPLRHGAVAARVRHPLLWGVAGLVYGLETRRPLKADLIEVPYASATIRQTVAYRAVLTLCGVTPVSVPDIRDGAVARAGH